MNRKILVNTLLSVSFSSFYAQTIVTDRPDQSEASTVVPQGALQVECGFLMENNEGETGWTMPTTLFRYGTHRLFELRFVNELFFIKPSNQNRVFSGINDFQIGTKIQLLNKEERKTKLSFISHLSLPTGTNYLTSNNLQSINKLCFSMPLNENLSLGYNLGYNYLGNKQNELFYSLALGIGVNDKIACYFEPYGTYLFDDDLYPNFDCGFTYLPNDNLQLDFSFGTGLGYEMNYASVGMSWLFLKD